MGIVHCHIWLPCFFDFGCSLTLHIGHDTMWWWSLAKARGGQRAICRGAAVVQRCNVSVDIYIYILTEILLTFNYILTTYYLYVTILLSNRAMERSTILKFGKSSISMGHLYHGYVCHNQTVSYWLLVKTVQRSPEALIGDSLFQFSPTWNCWVSGYVKHRWLTPSQDRLPSILRGILEAGYIWKTLGSLWKTLDFPRGKKAISTFSRGSFSSQSLMG